MTDLSWLTEHRLDSVVRNEFNWDFVFSAAVNLRAECLWRLLIADRIILTSEDHGHQFGLPAPVDCVTELRERVVGANVDAVSVREGTLDLAIHFQTGATLELIPDSSGYEAWQLGGRNMLVIATGGGRLDVFRDD